MDRAAKPPLCFDVVIVGAGIIGLSIAWELTRRSKLSIAVLDKGAGIGEGSTGASSAICRHRYSMDEMVRLAQCGISAYRNWREYIELDTPAAAFCNDGVLWMPGNDLTWADDEKQRMQRLGIVSDVLDAKALIHRFPALSACTETPDVETGQDHTCHEGGRYLFERDGGYMDPTAAATDLVEACRSKGVQVLFRSEVTAVQSESGRVSSVTLATGQSLSAPVLVNAAGPWCQSLSRAAGVELEWDLHPTRIQMLYLDRPEVLAGDIPVTVDMAGGIYFRTQNRGQQLIVGSVLEADERESVANPDDFDRQADDMFQHTKLHLLCHRLPTLPARGTVRSYCGLYTVNRDDVHPIVGPTGLDGFWVANGFSGHGFKLAPAIGALVAQGVSGESLTEDPVVPTNFFAVDRTPFQLASRSVLA
ncbi:MAG: NAD(P)/FAD-dependent oxidoreductase [Lysobacterales bacterium]